MGGDITAFVDDVRNENAERTETKGPPLNIYLTKLKQKKGEWTSGGRRGRG